MFGIIFHNSTYVFDATQHVQICSDNQYFEILKSLVYYNAAALWPSLSVASIERSTRQELIWLQGI